MNLTPKQKRFCDEYLANGMNATQAAISAGYSKKGAEVTGSNLLRNTKVASVLRKEQDKTAEKLNITREMILEALWQNHQLALTPEGETGRVDVRASSDALDKLNKMQGNYTEKRDITTNGESINTTPIIINGTVKPAN
jgi:hypothetical protein